MKVREEVCGEGERKEVCGGRFVRGRYVEKVGGKRCVEEGL